ncbi:MAG: hypothetical protein ACPG19_09440 [Saprospiraceae bacterium]
MKHHFNNQNTYELDCIKNALRIDRNLQLIFGIIAVLFGGWLLLFVFKRFSWIFAALALVMLFSGIRLLYDVFRFWKMEQTYLIRLLFYQPQEIVWVYSIVTEKLPFGVALSKKGTMYFKLLNGDEITIKLDDKEMPLISKCLHEVLPHATFGYSKEKEQWYMANPAMLLK